MSSDAQRPVKSGVDVVRAYQRVLLGEGAPLARGADGPWKPVVMEVDSREFLMAQWPDGSLADIRTAVAINRFEREMKAAVDAPPALGLLENMSEKDVLMIDAVQAFSNTSAPSLRPKREGNRAQRRKREKKERQR